MPEIIATYRVQLNKDFTFDDLIEILFYLHEIGISHIYCSPIFESVSGSVHGYDVIDPLRISAERGGMEGLLRLDAALLSMDPPMKMILDIVPNHMSTHPDNPYWHDVLEKGVGSKYWRFFDLRVPPGQKIRLPCLDRELIKIFRSGDADIEEKGGKFVFRLYDRRFPLKAASMTEIQNVNTLTDEEKAVIVRQQNYDLVHWYKGLEQLSYRRFFDVVDLIGVRMEDPEVFEFLHSLLFEIKEKCKSLEGVRVDHIDGLADPEGYLLSLTKHFDNIWVEKILMHDEKLPESWAVLGTTGYEFIDRMNGIFMDAEGFRLISRYWHESIESSWENFDSCVISSREKVLTDMFLPEFQRVTGMLATDERTWYFWKALTLMLSVYRTYTRQGQASEDDIACIEAALRKAGLFPGWERRVASRLLQPRAPDQVRGMQEWQQLTGPLMAKGLEDTAHYRYTPLAALNEVGCTPESIGFKPDSLVAWLTARHQDHPCVMNASSTHDTKRSEDARCRLYALSSFPREWISFVQEAQNLNREMLPHDYPKRVEYFLYQALVSTWPFQPDIAYSERIIAYMRKATREMKLETSWLRPDAAFDRQTEELVHQCISSIKFQDHISRFMELAAPAGAIFSLSTLTLKVLSSGVPDIYQGTELWNFYLVDPDNRRPVDYRIRQGALAGISKEKNRVFLLGDLCRTWQDGRIKLWLMKRLLEIRKEIVKEDATLFGEIAITGRRANQLLSYCIMTKDQKKGWIVTLPVRLDGLRIESLLSFPTGYWADTYASLMERDEMTDCISGKQIRSLKEFPVDVLFRNFPVSVLSFS